MNPFEGLTQRVRGIWMAELGRKLGRCSTHIAGDPGDASEKVGPWQGPATRRDTLVGNTAVPKTGGQE